MKFSIEKYHQSSPSIFDFLIGGDLNLIKKKMIRQEVKKGDYLFKEGNYARGIYIMLRGKIKIFQLKGDGKQSIVYIYKKGDFFGYRLLLADEPIPLSACAMENTVVNIIPGELFFDLLDSSSFFAKKLLAHLSKEFSVWINKMTIFSQYGVRERVAMSLLILARIYKKSENWPDHDVAIAINRDDFAAYVGTAKETLVRMLRQFKDDKIIITKGTKIIILKEGVLLSMVSEM